MHSFDAEAIPAPYQCPVTATMQVIGGKWKIIILWAVTNGVNRFGALQRAIPGITKKMLTSELRALESAGLIDRKIFPVMPPKVEYSVTPLGETLRPVLNMMGEWGRQHVLTENVDSPASRPTRTAVESPEQSGPQLRT